jgi:hypothetical protein
VVRQYRFKENPKMEEMGMSMTLIPLVLFLVALLVVVPLVLALVVLPFWIICKKAGFHGALSLLMLVPIGNLILPFMLAFMDWPALQRRE